MQGTIVKGIAGFYYVYVDQAGTYECKAKGILRHDGTKPLVGDRVEISVVDAKDMIGNVDNVLERDNALIRPAVANIDQALVIFAAKDPNPQLGLLDRFLISMEYYEIPVIICFNKADLVSEEELLQYSRIYESAGYKVIFTSTKTGQGIAEIKQLLKGRTTTVAGPSGAGKSSLVNCMEPMHEMETGEISYKIGRGKNTTRHTELLPLACGGLILDTPGFSSLDLPDIEKERLRDFYPEFVPYEPGCRFTMCMHYKEPDCAVRQALDEGVISKDRYDNYIYFFELLKGKEYK